jgi:lipopolysaccharide transport system ATP-binding protein
MDSTSNDIILTVDNISKKYFFTQQNDRFSSSSNDNSFFALDKVSFSLRKGDTLGIIGSNGSGKTTLLKILSQAIAPSAGRATIGGKLIPIIDIGSGFHPDLTGRENVFLYGTVMLGMTKNEIQEQLNAIIDFSELGQFIDEPLKNYSNGMYLRLALSVALFCKLDILLLDEVFSVGDSSFMLKSYDKMSQIIKQAATVILASHNMDDIMRICNKCLWLEKGVIKMFGNTNDIVSAYLSSSELLSREHSGLSSFVIQQERTWTQQSAPQSKEFQLVSMCIKNEGDDLPKNSIDYNLPIYIEIEYEKLLPDCDIAFVLIFADYYNTTLLITSSVFHKNNVRSLKGETGTYKQRCIFPKQLLNLGVYKINLQAVLNESDPLILIPNILSFHVTTPDNDQSRILKGNPVRFVPTLPWEINKVL